MIAIIDYGAGNLRSVSNTLDEIGAEYKVLTAPAGLESFEKVILPGVGHFGQMMRAMDERDLRQAVLDRAASGVPLLGICVGLQCMFEGSEEAPDEKGLALFPGTITRFPQHARVPQMGWNCLDRLKTCRLLDGLDEHPYVYFAHSYYAPMASVTSASCTYELPYTAVLQRDNVYAVQFHPEKSGPVGLKVMRNFVESC
jgi:imidazole glycerol-phosphate synthase subunit HisH